MEICGYAEWLRAFFVCFSARLKGIFLTMPANLYMSIRSSTRPVVEWPVQSALWNGLMVCAGCGVRSTRRGRQGNRQAADPEGLNKHISERLLSRTDRPDAGLELRGAG